MFGAGANGIAFVEGPQCSLAVDRNVAVFFQGELSYELPDELESPAHDILRRYANEELSTSKCPCFHPPKCGQSSLFD